MADVEAFSVDPLCDLGAKNFNLVLNSFLLIECLARTLRCLSVISAFFFRLTGSVVVRDVEKCLIRGRAVSFSLVLVASVQGSP